MEKRRPQSTSTVAATDRRLPGRRARRQAEIRERILRAALALFERQGFFATTVEQITDAADVGKGTFFNYFPSKEHALAGFGQLQLAKVGAAVGAAQGGDVPVREVLRRLAYALAEEPGRSQSLVRSLMMANMSSEPVRQLMLRNLARGRRLLAKLIARGQQLGEIRQDSRPIELARLFQQTYFGTMILWALHPPSKLTDWLESTFDVFWSGVEPRRERT